MRSPLTFIGKTQMVVRMMVLFPSSFSLLDSFFIGYIFENFEDMKKAMNP